MEWILHSVKAHSLPEHLFDVSYANLFCNIIPFYSMEMIEFWGEKSKVIQGVVPSCLVHLQWNMCSVKSRHLNLLWYYLLDQWILVITAAKFKWMVWFLYFFVLSFLLKQALGSNKFTLVSLYYYQLFTELVTK